MFKSLIVQIQTKKSQTKSEQKCGTTYKRNKNKRKPVRAETGEVIWRVSSFQTQIQINKN